MTNSNFPKLFWHHQRVNGWLEATSRVLRPPASWTAGFTGWPTIGQNRSKAAMYKQWNVRTLHAYISIHSRIHVYEIYLYIYIYIYLYDGETNKGLNKVHHVEAHLCMMHKCIHVVTKADKHVGITCSNIPSFYTSWEENSQICQHPWIPSSHSTRAYMCHWMVGRWWFTYVFACKIWHCSWYFLQLERLQCYNCQSRSGQWQPAETGIWLNNKQHV